MRDNILQIEAPDTKAVVDYLSAHFKVTIEVEGGTVRIQVEAPHGEDASTWDHHDFEIVLPEYETLRYPLGL